MTDPAARPEPRAPGRLASFLVSERVVVPVIVLNAAALFVAALTDDGGQVDRVALGVDYACVVFFLLEAALKIHLAGLHGYLRNGWNRFDLALVISSSPVLLAPVVDLQYFGVFLVLRLGRLFRLFRLLHFVPNRDHLIQGVRRSLRASVGVVLALMLLNFILALGATFLFGRFAPEHFGNPLLAMYSMFRVFTIEGWSSIPDLIVQRATNPVWGVLARAYFAGSVLVGGVVGLSLANAVFVDEMTADNNDDLETKVDALRAELADLRKALGVPPSTVAVAAPDAAPAGPTDRR